MKRMNRLMCANQPLAWEGNQSTIGKGCAWLSCAKLDCICFECALNCTFKEVEQSIDSSLLFTYRFEGGKAVDFLSLVSIMAHSVEKYLIINCPDQKQ